MDNKVEIKIGLKGVNEIKSKLKAIKGSFEHLKKSIFSLRTAAVGIVAGYGLYKLADALKESSQLAAQEQFQIMQLEAVFKSMNRTTKGFTESMIKLADSQELATGYSDDEVMSAEHMLATFTTISNKAMPEVLKTTEDLARGWGIDLVQAARIMGIASMGLTGELTRYGITLSAEAVKTKNFGLILKDIQTQVSGSANAFRYSFLGITTTFHAVLEDTQRILGDLENNVLSPFFEAATQQLNKFNTKWRTLGKNADVIKQWQEVTLITVDRMVHTLGFLYNFAVKVAQGFEAVKLSIQGIEVVALSFMGVVDYKARVMSYTVAHNMTKTIQSIESIGLKRIPMKNITEWFDNYKKAVLKAEKTIANARKKIATIGVHHIKKANMAILSNTSKMLNTLQTEYYHFTDTKIQALDRWERTEKIAAKKMTGNNIKQYSKIIEWINKVYNVKLLKLGEERKQAAKGINNAIATIELKPFALFKYNLNEQVEAYRKAGISEVLIAKYKADKMAQYNRQTLTKMEKVGQDVAESLQHSFSSLFFDAMQGKLKSLSSYFASFAASVEQMISKMLAKMMIEYIFQNVLKVSMAGFANGGAFVNGVQAFASGGIISQPTIFPMANGGIGLAGEAGAEAIMPLSRNSRGELGVKSSGGSSGHVHLNIVNTVDPSVVSDYLASPSGENTILNVIQKNSYQIKRTLEY